MGGVLNVLVLTDCSQVSIDSPTNLSLCDVICSPLPGDGQSWRRVRALAGEELVTIGSGRGVIREGVAGDSLDITPEP